MAMHLSKRSPSKRRGMVRSYSGIFATSFLFEKEYVDDKKRHADGEAYVGDVKNRKIVAHDGNDKIDEIEHRGKDQTVDEVA